MYKKILVPLDGSEFGEYVLDHVKAIAKGCQVKELILLQVIEPPSFSFKASKKLLANYHEIDDKFERPVQVFLSQVAKTLKKSGVNADIATKRITHGSAADGILDYAKENCVDLIIMTTHGKSGLTSWHFGSVANKVTRDSPIPVLIVTPSGFRTGRYEQIRVDRGSVSARC